MEGFVRTKRVTYRLDDEAKARIVGHEPVCISSSSGSEHGGDNDDQSPSLSDLVHSFLEDDYGGFESPDYASDYERDVSISMTDQTGVFEDPLNPIVIDKGDPFTNSLSAYVLEATAVFSCVKSNELVFRRNVMAFLRERGYNAAICKTKWETTGGLTAGNYEFIDVVPADSVKSPLRRYLVDLDFAGEFDIARPTKQYESLLRTLPRVFVGNSEELKRIVKVMSDAAKRSLKSRGLSLPPWRKSRYMQNKWLGPYRLMTNSIPASVPISAVDEAEFGSKCRSVGFDAVNAPLFFPASTRTIVLTQ